MEQPIIQSLVFDMQKVVSLEDSSNSFQFLFFFVLVIICSYIVSSVYKYSLDDKNF